MTFDYNYSNFLLQIVNHIGGKTNVMLISKLILQRNSNIILFVIPVYFIYLRYILRIINYGHFRVCYTFLGSIFAVCYVALSPVRILTGLCFVGTPPPLSVDFDWATSTLSACGPFQQVPVRPQK